MFGKFLAHVSNPCTWFNRSVWFYSISASRFMHNRNLTAALLKDHSHPSCFAFLPLPPQPRTFIVSFPLTTLVQGLFLSPGKHVIWFWKQVPCWLHFCWNMLYGTYTISSSTRHDAMKTPPLSPFQTNLWSYRSRLFKVHFLICSLKHAFATGRWSFYVWRAAGIHVSNGNNSNLPSTLAARGVTLPTACGEACRCDSPAMCLRLRSTAARPTCCGVESLSPLSFALYK